MGKLKKLRIKERLISQHRGAKKFFGDRYNFSAKQGDLLFYLGLPLGEARADLDKDLKMIEKLTKGLEKKRKMLQEAQEIYDIASSITEEDI